MLHSEYITSCFMAKGKKCRMTQHNKQAKQTFHCFVLNSHFIHPSEYKYVLFVCLSIRMQVSFISLHFRYFGWRFFFRIVDLSRESRVVPPSLRFSRKKSKLFFHGCCQPRKLKSAKNNPHVFKTKPQKFGDAKISHYTVLTISTISGPVSLWTLQLSRPV